ncbi:MAG TPA: lysylphosphatidylglycerol synthase transmembrane domain-containing protein [Solirubrobacteraceae bacterium]|nr:lysylphosphatidylglycerol synthase transmembrane domain-containing protein [Solirubrobacteraceae bacterium]
MSGQAAGPGAADRRRMPEELHPRHLIIRGAEIVALIAVVVIAISALPGLDEVRARLRDAGAVWVVAVVVAEFGSCAGYLLVFRATFCAQMPWGLSYDIAMAELAANSLLPAGGAGGLALGVWALRQAGMPTGHIGRRTVAFFVVTSAANFFSVILVGLAAFIGIVPGGHSPVLTLGPALITALGVVLVALSPRLLRALGNRGEGDDAKRWPGRARRALRSGLTTVADGVEQAIALLRSHGSGVIAGSFSYMAFDIAALGFAFAAIGRVPAFGALVLGYLIGQLGNLMPIPGGIGATEGGLIGVFALYGVNLSQATAAVLIYRLLQLTVPALLGLPAFVMLRRKLVRADRPALVCAPLALEVVNLPARS